MPNLGDVCAIFFSFGFLLSLKCWDKVFVPPLPQGHPATAVLVSSCVLFAIVVSCFPGFSCNLLTLAPGPTPLCKCCLVPLSVFICSANVQLLVPPGSPWSVVCGRLEQAGPTVHSSLLPSSPSAALGAEFTAQGFALAPTLQSRSSSTASTPH